MSNRLNLLKKEYQELQKKLTDPAIISQVSELQKITQKIKELETLISLYEDLSKTEKEIKATSSVLKDPEMEKLAQEELQKLNKKKESLEKKIKIAELPPDPEDKKNIIMEIRAGAGGEEAALFAADLFRMYSRYAEKKNWKVEIMNSNRTGLGGFKEIILGISGKNVYQKLKYESGVHRVQRIPETESSGRLHTSTATVAVLPEAEEIEIKIDPADLKIETFRSSAPGGQHANVTDSAVRITHLPTGLVASCQDEKSQFKNKEKALKILRSRILAQKQEEERKKRGEARRIQIGTGERSEKIRTYNFPQNRITDHRIGYSAYDLESIMDGHLDRLLGQLIKADQEKKLALLK